MRGMGDDPCMARRRSEEKGPADDVMLEFRQRAQPDIELEEFFDLSIDPLSIIDFEGVFKRVNASFLRLLGYSEVELLSRSALDVLHPDDVDSARAALAQLAVGHDMVGFEARVVCADGSIRWLEWNTRSMQERGVVYSVGRDITDRRYVEAELRETQRSLAASRDELAVLAEEQAALGGSRRWSRKGPRRVWC